MNIISIAFYLFAVLQNMLNRAPAPVLIIDGDGSVDGFDINTQIYSKVIYVTVHTSTKAYNKWKRLCGDNPDKFTFHTVNTFNNKAKETTDKYICLLMEKLSIGVKEIHIKTNDFDFYQICRMSRKLGNATKYVILVDESKPHRYDEVKSETTRHKSFSEDIRIIKYSPCPQNLV